MEFLKTIFSNEVLASNGSISLQPTVKEFFICLVMAVSLGIIMAVCYMFRNDYSKNLVVSIAVMPAIITVMIMLVSGNLGAAVAVGGVFALTRFRSAQGTAREITHVLLAMATGLTLGLGYIYIATVMVAVVEAMNFLFIFIHFGENCAKDRTLKITIPENLDYTGLFDDLFEEYTYKNELKKVKLSNLGTMFQLTYTITFKDITKEKEFLDKVRERNGNLDILCSKVETNREEL
jgi:hypothetical protein